MRAPAATFLLLAAACATPSGAREAPAPAASAAGDIPVRPGQGLPAGFVLREILVVEEAFLDPGDTWRALVSRLTTLRADAMASGDALLVTFEEDAMHATDERGRRRSWRLPEGLRLLDTPRHLLLAADGRAEVYDAAGVQVPLAQDVIVTRARVRTAAGEQQEIRLVVKDGPTFRSIQTAG